METIIYNHKKDWYFEGNISNILVSYLKSKGYNILKDNSENTRARGEDIIATSPWGVNEIIEVKGYPTVFYTKGKDHGKPKPTNPKLQAKHWFSEALLSSIFNYTKNKGQNKIQLALAFPSFDRYYELIEKVENYFTDNNLDFIVYIINEDKTVKKTNLNRKLRDSNSCS